MNKYNDSKIYKIVDNTNNNVYIGSTCRKYISQRLQGHVQNYKLYVRGLHHFVSSYEILKNGNYDIILIENVNCETVEQLRKRERFFIETTPNCINLRIPSRTKQEQRDDYYKKNKDVLLEKGRVWRENNKDKIEEYKVNYADRKLILAKELYEKNKDAILERMRQPCECECGSTFRYGEKARHNKSKKHLNFISNK